MKVNVGFTDRIIRVLSAALIAGLVANKVVIGIGAIILTVIIVVLTLTSVFGICPLYTLLGINTIAKT